MPSAAFTKSLADLGPEALRQRRPSLVEAQEYCQNLAESHYENFTVVSWLLPKELRQHFCNVYAYCRWADDLADETGDPDRSSVLLDWWERQLDDCYAPGHESLLRHPVFIALTETVRRFEIPSEPFRDLLSAFRQDQRVMQYETAEDVIEYCRRSANPVGRMILCLGGVRDAQSELLSDAICTGLQLANFCQDVANDWDRGRVYLPQETLHRVGYTRQDFKRRVFNTAFRAAMEIEVARAEALLRRGEPLVERVPRELRFDIALFIAGGLAILDAIRRQDYNVWAKRPALSKFQKLRIASSVWLRSSRSGGVGEWESGGSHTFKSPPPPLAHSPTPASLPASYALCRDFTRRSASNFAWAFWLLPKQKRMAMYALYAFLRKIDDLGDNNLPVAVRRADLDEWRLSLDAALAGTFDDPLLPAVADTVRRFSIPVQHLTDVIDGVAMDCLETNSDEPRFGTFAELEHYCELVASAVGMACIHIWGFSDPAAVEPARQCGIAFQLTNILRDLKQDADQGRIYLPREDFERVGYTAIDLRRGLRDARFAALVRLEVERAEGYYQRAAELQRYLDPAGQRLFGTMMSTYRGLLEKIKQVETGVLAERVRLSRLQKLRIVGRWLLLRPKPAFADPVPGAAI